MAKEVNKRVNVWINGKEVENNVKSIRAAMVQLTNQLNKMDIGSAEYIETSKKLRDLKAIYDEHCKSLKMTNQEIENNTTSWKKNIIHWGAFAAAAQGASAAIQRFVAATQEYVDAYATLDDAMSAVQKTTGMTREEVEGLHKSLKSIDTRTSTNELLKISEIGGRMGIAKDQIQGFTEAVNKANVALGDSFQGGAEEISSILGKISLAYKETRDQDIGKSLTQIGSALNEVGASANATEGNIAAFVQRVGSMPEVFRPTVQQAVALGAAFEESSIDAEVASRAFGIVMTKASTNVEKFATAMHRPIEEVRELINTNPAQFFVEFAESLNGLNATEVGSVLKDLKLNADGVNKIIGAMSTNTERFTEILNTSNTAFAEAVSLDKEYAVVNENAAAQLEKAKKAVEDAKAALGEELMPVIAQLTKISASGLSVTREVVKFALQHKGLVIALASAYGALRIAQKMVNAAQKEGHALTLKNMAVGKAYKSVVFLLTAAKAKLAGATGAATLAQKQFKAAFASTPWGAIIVAIGAVVGGIVKLVEKQREAEKAAEEMKKAVSEMAADNVAKVEHLADRWKLLGDNLEEKEKFIKQNKDAFDELGVSINSVYEAENLLVNNKDAFVNSLLQRAYAAAMMQKAQSVMQENLKYTMDYSMQAKVLRDQANEVQEELDELQEYNSEEAFIRKAQLVEEKLRYENMAKGYEKKVDEINREAKKLMTLADNVSKSVDESLKNMGINTISTGVGPESSDGSNQGNAGNSESGVAEKELKERETFQKKLAQMRTKEQTDLLTGWEKTKQQIIDKYKEMEDEAVKLYGENSQMLKDVQSQRDQAIAEAGQKYIQDMIKILNDASKKIEEWQKEVNPGSGNEILDKLLGKKAEWVKRASDLQTHLETLRDTRLQFIADNVDTSTIDAEITRTEDYLAKISTMQVADLKQFLEQYQKEVSSFITTEQEDLTNSTLTETQRQKTAITEKYRLEIELIEKLKAARRKAMGEDADISDLEEQINKLIDLRDKLLANVDRQYSGGLQGKNIWQQLAEFDWKNMGDNWQQGIDLITNSLNEFANTALSIFNSISQMQNNAAQAEFEAYSEAQDRKTKALKKQLDSGLISQAKYDAQIAKMEEEKEKKEKEMKHEQFEREKTANTIQTIISGAVAAATTLAQWGVPWGLIPMGISLALTAAETALVASQPNPYARGGFIRGKQIAMMGEEGDEWVASHMLLSDKKTAPVISALEKYQQGDSRALDMLSVPEPSWEKLQQSSRKLSRTFASSTPVNNYYYTNSNNTTTSDNSELLAEIRQMNSFLKDPKNRQAVISRKIQLEFERFEDDVRQRARL